MVRQLWVQDTWTGAPLLQVHPVSGRWTSRISGSEDASFVFELRDANMGKLPQELIADLFRENARMLAVRDGETVEFCGPIKRVEDDPLSGRMTVNAQGLRDFAGKRMTFPVDNWLAGDLTISSRSAAGAVRQILERMTYWSSEWYLPIDLPAAGSGVYSRAVKFWEMQNINRLLQSVEAEGNEIWLRPYVTGYEGVVRFQTRVAPQVTIGTFLDVMSAAGRSPLTKLKRTSDGGSMATGVMVAGRGTERDTKTAYAGFMSGPSIPVSDVLVTKKDIASVGELQRIAAASLAERRAADVQWSMELSTELVDVSRMLPGSLIRLDVRGDRLRADGQHLLRVVSLSGSWGSTKVTPEVKAYG